MSMQAFRCGLTGIADLTLECAEILLAAGHPVRWLVSSNARLRAGAVRLGIPAWESFAELEAAEGEAEVDYLFSIINDVVLPPHVLSLPRCGAINYHNSPLPRYAGVHATSWALLNGEPAHAVTWHEMTEVVDGGDILKQMEFPLRGGETGLDANLACHDQAVRSFRELIEELSRGTVRRTPQDLSARSYYAAHRKAPGGGLICWTAPAEAIDRTVRAHTLGRSWNTFGTAKVLLDERFLVPLKLKVLPETSSAPPGTIVAAGEEGLRITTGSTDVLLEVVLELDGEARPAGETGVAAGTRLPPPPAGTAAALERFLTAASRAERFWRHEFSATRTTTLPLAPSLAEAAVSPVRAHTVELPPELRTALAARFGEGKRLRDAVLAAFLGYLHRFGESDTVSVRISTPELRDAARGLEPFVADHVPLSVELRDEETVESVLARLVERVEELQRRGPFCRDLFLRYREQPCPLPVSVRVFRGAEAGEADSLLTLLLAEDGTRFRFTSRPTEGEVYLREALEQASAHLLEVLRSCAGSDGRTMHGLRPVSVAERARMLGEWSGAPADLGAARSLWERFEGRCREAPGAVAVTGGGRALTYSALHDAAHALADSLAAHGVRRGDPVAVFLHRGPDLAAAVLGLLRAGAVYVPLQADWPAERRAFVLADTGARVLLADAGGEAGCPGFTGAVLSVGGATQPSPAAVELPAFRAPEPDEVAYVMYTSGSTGTPKGILSTHGGIANRILWSVAEHGIRAGDVLLQTASPGFDISYWELLTPLVTGARLVISEHQEQGVHPYLVETIRRESVTVAHFVPSLLASFLAELPPGTDLPLREVVCGGEALTPDVQRRFFERSGARLHHAYGPTEASISVTQWHCRSGGREAVVPVGRPIANARIHVLDRHLEPVPVGTAGEVFIGGRPLATGYLNRSDLTAERFIPSPFGGEPGARLYRTGDIGRCLDDGSIELLGRVDHQIKIRGHRVEPGEVEAVLAGHPQVERTVVMARRDPTGEPRLVAYVEEAGGSTAPLSRRQLRRHAAERLPTAAVPTAWVVLERFPMLPNGKLDRDGFPEPVWGEREDADGYVAPRNTLEVRLCDQWARRLGVPQVGTHDDFFALGGHSLVATRILSWIYDTLGVRLSLGDFFRARTVAGLAERLQAGRRAGDSDEPELKPLSRANPLPLSFAQQRIWFEEQLLNHPGVYNVPVLIRLEGALRPDALGEALDRILHRHEGLRCTIRMQGEAPMQLFAEPAPFPLEWVDLTIVPPPERPARLDAEVEHCARAPFDLVRGPLVRGRLVRTGDHEHVLVLALHHLVGDRWTIEVLFRELVEVYDALLEEREPTLPELTVWYADYAVWQRERLRASAVDADLAYWERTLAGIPDVLDLRMGRARPAQPTYRAGRLDMRLPERVLRELQALGEEQGATPFMLLLAVFEVVLHRYSGEDDIVVGSPIANRSHPATHGMAGVFVNSVAFRLDCRGNPRFLDVLRQVRQATVEAHAHQELPFERLVERLGVHRDPARHPLFQVMFVLNESWKSPVSMRDLRTTFLPVPSYYSLFDLTLNAREERDGISLEFEYAADLFDESMVARLADSFRHLLEGCLENPEAAIGVLPLADGEESRRWVEAGRGAEGGYDTCAVHRLFEGWAARTPDAPAVLHGGETLTYAGLDAEAERLAAALRAHGVAPGTVVAVCMDRSPLLVASLLAVLKAGGAFLSLDGSDPEERLRATVEESGAPLVLTTTGWSERLARVGCRHLLADGDRGSSGCPARPLHPTHAHDLAYVIYTSGSTGRPKGVMVEHHSLVNHVHATRASFGLSPADRVLQFAAPTFDAVIEEIFPTLCSGAALVIRTEEMVHSTRHFLRGVEAQGVTIADLPTAFWHTLTEEIAAAELPLPASLRLVVIGGERARPEQVALWNRRVVRGRPGLRLLNTYGPTEATVVATAADVGEDQHGTGDVSIGHPVRNACAFVLDRHLRPLPPGVAGELYLGGDCLARGYLGQPALTAERFVPDPFSLRPGGRLYRTGDLVRRREDGHLEYVGRVDHQVKIRGFRVELGEVENRLAEHPGVADVGVLVEEGVRADSRIVAYVVPRPGEDLGVQGLRRYMADRLPSYMLPSAYVLLEALPRTVRGKLDRRALPAPEREDSASGAYVAPRTSLEQDVCAVWEEVLGVSPVGVRDNFFTLGGHSLLAVTLAWKIRDRCGLAVSLRTLFEHPTVEGIAAEAERVEPGAVPGAVPAGEGPTRAPLSWSQQGMWVQDRIAQGTGLYNIPVALSLRGPLDVPALEAAFGDVLARHDALRITLMEWDGGVGQQVHPPEPFTLPQVDLRAFPGDRVEAETARLLREGAMRPFDLFSERPVRVSLFRVSEEHAFLLLVLHHAIADAWSLERMCRDLDVRYRCRTGETVPDLPPVGVQYPRVALDQRTGPADPAGLAFWTARLAGAPGPLELPFDRTPPAVRDHRGEVHLEVLSGSSVERLRALGRECGATLYMALLAAFQAFLHRYTGTEDIVVGSPVAGRDDPACRETVGPFVNTVALRTAVHGGTSFRELLRRVRASTLDALSYQTVPFQQVARALEAERSAGRHPLFQVMFDLEEAGGSPPALGQLAVTSVPLEMPVAKFDLALSVRPLDSRMELEFRYPVDAFDAATVARMAGHFLRLLESATDRPDDAVGELDLLSDEEVRRQLVDWNRTATSLAEAPDLVACFDGVAAREPDAAAVVAGERSVTYRQLQRRAERLAACLLERGLAPEAPVAVHMDRSIELVTAVLGIWKAGGVYVPLDPAQPVPRLQHILLDSGARLVVTRCGAEAGWAAEGCELLVLGADGEPPSAAPAHVSAPLSPDRLAYVMYTSGSTGRPKGVLCTHGGIANRLLWARGAHPTEPGEGVLQLAAPGFDISLWEIFHPLLAGGRLVIAEPERQRSLDHVVERIQAGGVTTAHFVPALLDLFLDHPEARHCRTLRQVVCGGDRLSPALRRKHREVLGIPLHQAYGPTEASISVTHQDLGGPEHPDRVPLGRPIANTRIYLLSPCGSPVPVGVAGEIHVGGAALARGYLHDPALTAERFVPDPFSATPGARMYRTGDLARWLSDGTVEFIGRRDAQVKIHGVRVEPGEIEAVLREHPEVAQVVVAVRMDGDRPRLVAYAVPAGEGSARLPQVLRRYAAERLPAAMVPAALVVLEALPLTPNGKVDRDALPAPTTVEVGQADESGDDGWSDAERAVAAIWRELLSLEAVGLHDDLFQLGGDSVVAIRMVARARSRGLRIDVRQVFATPTVAGIAAAAIPEAPEAVAPPADGDGAAAHEVPLTSIQRRFFALKPRVPNHLNQAVLLHPAEPLDADLLRSALAAVVAQHDALRLRFHRNGGIPHTAACAAPGAADFVFRVARVNGSDEITGHAARIHGSLDLEHGPLVGALLAEEGGRQHLLLVAHHLVVDASSWDFLLDDLEAAYRRLRRGEAVRLPRRTASFRDWASASWRHAATDALQAQIEYWLEALPVQPPPLPLDHPGGDNTHGSVRAAWLELDAAATSRLVQGVHAYRMQVDELLLTALVQAFGDWTGEPRLLATREWHGRSEGATGLLDLSRTAGWFTTVYPVYLALGRPDDLPEALKTVKERLRAVPEHGTGYGLLRYGPDGRAAARLAASTEPRVGFNYLGQSRTQAGGGLFGRTDGGLGPSVAAENEREHVLEVTAQIVDGTLRVEMEYSIALHEPTTAEYLLGRFRSRLAALVEHCSSPGTFGYTPSDFPLAAIDQAQLDAVLGDVPGVQEVFPLAPMQAGLLFRRLAAPDSSDYHTQIVFELEGEVDGSAFRAAWEAVAARHACFRTSFLWDRVDEPLQVVHAEVRHPWRQHDWRTVPEAMAEERLERLLAEDRRESFDLACAPLSRLHWIDFPAGRRLVLWSHHHIVLDGWSLPLVLQSVAAAYEELCRGRPCHLPAAPSYSRYVAWMRGRDEGAAEEFWRSYLSGIHEPTLLLRRHTVPGKSGGARRSHSFALSPEQTAALTAVAEAHRVTLGTVTLALWSLLVHQYTRRADVVTGVVLSVRPPEIPDVEEVVGLCIHTLPLRVRVSEDLDLADLFAAVQDDVLHIYEHAGVSLNRLQSWTNVSSVSGLFDSIVVFENYPGDRTGQPLGTGGRLRVHRAVETTEFPVSLIVMPGEALEFELTYASELLDPGTAGRISKDLIHLFAMVADGMGEVE